MKEDGIGKVCSIVYQIQGRGLEFPVGIANMWLFLCWCSV